MRTAIIAFSVDPVTYGHDDIITRVLQSYDHVILAIGNNIDKKYTFSIEEREHLLRQVIGDRFSGRVTIKTFSNMTLADFALENNVRTIIRGVRNSIDVAFEQIINDVNKASLKGIDVYILFADKKFSHISSSVAKDIIKNFGGNILEYVPMIVKRTLEQRILKQYRIGITGEIGAGKTSVTEKLKQYICHLRNHIYSEPEYYHKIFGILSDEKEIIHSIDLDQIGHLILTKAQEPIYANVREQVIKRFGEVVRDKQCVNLHQFINIKALGNLIFQNEVARKDYDEITREAMCLMLRRQISEVKGIIFINCALLAESNILDFVNNDVIVVEADSDIRKERLKIRGYSPDEIENRMNAQLKADEKVNIIKQEITKHKCGSIIRFENNKPLDKTQIEKLVMKISKILQNNFYSSEI